MSDLLTQQELAQEWKVAIRTIYNDRQHGLPFIRFRGRIRIKRVDADNFENGRKINHHNHNKECRHE